MRSYITGINKVGYAFYNSGSVGPGTSTNPSFGITINPSYFVSTQGGSENTLSAFFGLPTSSTFANTTFKLVVNGTYTITNSVGSTLLGSLTVNPIIVNGVGKIAINDSSVTSPSQGGLLGTEINNNPVSYYSSPSMGISSLLPSVVLNTTQLPSKTGNATQLTNIPPLSTNGSTMVYYSNPTTYSGLKTSVSYPPNLLVQNISLP